MEGRHGVEVRQTSVGVLVVLLLLLVVLLMMLRLLRLVRTLVRVLVIHAHTQTSQSVKVVVVQAQAGVLGAMVIVHLTMTMAALGIKGQTTATHHGVLDALPGQVDHMHGLLVGAEVMQLSVGLGAAILSALKGLELEVDVGSLDVSGQRLALGEGLGASLDDAVEGL